MRADRRRAAPPAAHRGRARCRRASSRARRARRRCRTSATRSRPRRSAGWPACVAVNLQAGLQDVALWHERDISHSLGRARRPARLVAARVLRAAPAAPPARRAASSFPTGCATTSRRATAWCSASRCCWRSSQAGSTRDDAYRIVQRNAMQAWDERRDFRTLLEADPDVDAAGRSTTRSTSSARCAPRPRALGHSTGRVLEAPATSVTSDVRSAPSGRCRRCLSTRRLDADFAPRGVRDALALAVGLGDLDERPPRSPIGRPQRSMDSSSSCRSRRSCTSCSSSSGSAVVSSSSMASSRLLIESGVRLRPRLGLFVRSASR